MDELFRLLAESMPVGLAIWRAEDMEDPGRMRLLAVNQAAPGIVGRAGEGVGRTLAEVMPTLLERGIAHQWLEAVRAGAPADLGEVWYGDERVPETLFSIRVVPLPGDCVGVVFEDLSEQERRREELQTTKAYLEQLVRSSPVAVGEAMLDDFSLVYASPNVKSVLGYAPEDILGVPGWLPAHVHPDDLGKMHERLVQSLREHRTEFRGEYRLLCNDDQYRWFLNTARLIYGPDGRATRTIGYFVDINDRVLAEEEHQRLEAQLAQSRRLEAIGQLAGGIAHDFNNLLTVMLACGDFAIRALRDLQPGSTPEREEQFRDALADIEEVHAAAERAAQLTRRLLTFARRGVVRPEILDLNDVLRDLSSFLRRTLGDHIELVTYPAPRLRRIRADHGHVDEILLNLAVNARDAMSDGGALIIETANVNLDSEFCRARPGTTPGSYVLLSVKDTGTGMSPETLARAFEPFFTTKETGRGTGLGLATVYGVVTDAGGCVDLTSKLGAGTVVNVYLPAVDTDPAAAVAQD